MTNNLNPAIVADRVAAIMTTDRSLAVRTTWWVSLRLANQRSPAIGTFKGSPAEIAEYPVAFPSGSTTYL